MGLALHRPGGKRRRYPSRVSAAIVAIGFNIALLVVLIRWFGQMRVPASPTVEPIVVNLVFQLARPQYASRVRAINPRLLSVALQPPDRPPNLKIAMPIEIPSPKRSDIPASYSPGNAPKPREPPGAEGLPAVLVTGEQPGPALWEVTSATSAQHVLWILGLSRPRCLPRYCGDRSRSMLCLPMYSK